MKMKLCIGFLLLVAAQLPAQTNDLTALLQQGLFEEQANRNLDAAIASYQTLALQFDKDRQLAATAVFRLGECYRAQGRTNEAAVEYQRILRDFPEQQTLAMLSRQDLAGMGIAASATRAVENTGSENSDVRLWNKLKDVPKSELAKVLPTLVSDAALNGLLGKLNEARQNYAEVTNYYAPDNPKAQNVQLLMNELNNEINERINGVMQALQLRAELAGGAQTSRQDLAGMPPSGSDEDQEIVRIQQMIQNSPDLINAPNDIAFSTPLTKAAYNGWLKVAAYLLNHGADINIASPDCKLNGELASGGPTTPLLASVSAGNKAMTQFLIDHGADVKFHDQNGNTPLHLAAQKGFQAVAEVLLASHADANAQNNGGATPLFSAVKVGQIKIIQMLLTAGANPNTQDSKGRTPLSYAAETGDSQTVKLLLTAKANPNLGSLNPPLLCAVHKNDLVTAEELLQAGANPNLKAGVKWESSFGSTDRPGSPMYVAVSEKRLPLVQLLLKFKADPNDSQTDGQPVLFLALDQPDIVKALLEAGADAGAKRLWNGVYETLLQVAAEQNQGETVELLLQHGANPNVCNERGNSALHYATFNLSDEKVFASLLDHNANPNVRNNEGKTPLDIIKAALQDNNSWPARFDSLADKKAHAEKLVALLHNHGALDNLPDWNCITMSRPVANFSFPMFRKGTNDWNHFTLLETIANFYFSQQMYQVSQGNNTWAGYGLRSMLPFPDLTHVIIVRPNRGSTNETRLTVNLLDSTNGIDVAKDVPLEFGDTVEISGRDHALGESQVGLTDSQSATLADYTKGSVQLVAHGQTVKLPIDRVGNQATLDAMLNNSEARKLLLASSDLARVKVVRRDPKTGARHEWILDLSSFESGNTALRSGIGLIVPLSQWNFNGNSFPPANALWLRAGDVIEVPEKP